MLNGLRDKLTIKPVTLLHVEQYDELMRYVFQVTKVDLEKSGYEEGELIRFKRPLLQKAKVLGWFSPEDELVSSVSIYPFSVNIHGRIYQMGGISGVGTYPEYANLGLMNDLITLALKEMRDNGQYISYLYPYSIPYYRKKGWEIMSDHMSFSLKDTQLPKTVSVPGHVERLCVSDETVKSIYNVFSLSTHGTLIRNDFEWDEYWRWEDEEERIAAVYFDEESKPQGYLFYWINEDTFHIKEMIYITQEARHGLWNFINAHFSMIDNVTGNIYSNEPLAFLLEDSQISETIEPYFMSRIVDVENFLSAYPYDDEFEQFHFKVSDPIAEWNNGIFGLKKENSQIEIIKKPIGKSVELDIQTLSTLMMSYKSPSYLFKIGRIKTDLPTLRLLEKIIPTEVPYFSDYF